MDKELCVKVMQTTMKISHLKEECRLTASYEKSSENVIYIRVIQI